MSDIIDKFLFDYDAWMTENAPEAVIAIESLQAELTTANERIKELILYVEHHENCDHFIIQRVYRCTCGLKKLLGGNKNG